MEAVFEVTELDPLPFLNRREFRAEINCTSGQSRSFIAAGNILPDSLESAQTDPGALAPAVIDSGCQSLPRVDRDDRVLACPCPGQVRAGSERMTRLLLAAQTRGRVVDVSMSGVALVLTGKFTPGSRIAIRISNRSGGKLVDLTAAVLRCRQDGEGGWDVVCRFDKNLTFEQIHLIGENLFASTIV
jgi:hypothetical protein